MRAIIIDDERSAREAMLDQLNRCCPSIEVVAVCASGKEGLEKILEASPDLIFLDIEMPGMNGFQMLERLRPVKFAVIFTTAYDHFALRAFRVSAIDYLLKPVADQELLEAVQKVGLSLKSDYREQQLDILINNLQKPVLGTIALPILEGLIFEQVNHIVHCDSDNNYSLFHFSDGHQLLVTQTLKSVEVMLSPYKFFRVHNRHLINIAKVKKYVKGTGGYLIMENGSSIPVSRSRKDELMAVIERL